MSEEQLWGRYHYNSELHSGRLKEKQNGCPLSFLVNIGQMWALYWTDNEWGIKRKGYNCFYAHVATLKSAKAVHLQDGFEKLTLHMKGLLSPATLKSNRTKTLSNNNISASFPNCTSQSCYLSPLIMNCCDTCGYQTARLLHQ